MDYNNLPMDLGLALTTNRAALDRFVDMSDDEKVEFIERNRGVMSKNEIDRLVDSLAREDEKPDIRLENVNNIFKGPGV